MHPNETPTSPRGTRHVARYLNQNTLMTNAITRPKIKNKGKYVERWSCFHYDKNESRRLQNSTHPSRWVRWLVNEKKVEFKRNKNARSQWVPGSSPSPVLTLPNGAWLRWSDEKRYFHRGMNLAYYNVILLSIVILLKPNCYNSLETLTIEILKIWAEVGINIEYWK